MPRLSKFVQIEFCHHDALRVLRLQRWVQVVRLLADLFMAPVLYGIKLAETTATYVGQEQGHGPCMFLNRFCNCSRSLHQMK